jgi:hypothetical protein
MPKSRIRKPRSWEPVSVKVAILGPGALGCLLAAKFTLAGEEPWLVDYRPERVELLRRQGLLLKTPEETGDHLKVPIALAGEAGPTDLAILTVKAYQTRAAARSLPLVLGDAGIALTLQNGLGNLEEMARVLGPERLLGGASILGPPNWGKGRCCWPAWGPPPSARRRGRGCPGRRWRRWPRFSGGPDCPARSGGTLRRCSGKNSW